MNAVRAGGADPPCSSGRMWYGRHRGSPTPRLVVYSMLDPARWRLSPVEDRLRARTHIGTVEGYW